MGLLGRIGKNFAGQFRKAGDEYTDKNAFSMLDYGVGAPVVHAGLGSSIGALWGAAGSPDDPLAGAAHGSLQGAAIGAGGALAVGGGVMAKRMIVAVARALKNEAPHLGDEEVMSHASQLVGAAQNGNADAWAKLKSIGISDPREGMSGKDRDFFNRNHRGDPY